MIERLRKRIATGEREGGFTLIELLVVIIIIGILLAIAIPSYLSFRSRANASAAQANVRAAIPGVEAWYADTGAYTGVTETVVAASYDAGIKNVNITSSGAQTYCISSTVGDKMFAKLGPAADIAAVAGSPPTDPC